MLAQRCAELELWTHPSQWHGAVALLSAGMDARAVDGKDACKRCLAKVPNRLWMSYILRVPVPLLATVLISFSSYCTAVLHVIVLLLIPSPCTCTLHHPPITVYRHSRARGAVNSLRASWPRDWVPVVRRWCGSVSSA